MSKPKKAGTVELGMCECGSSMVAQGATMCKVCKALYDKDKRRAKAKAKARLKKAKKVLLKDEAIRAEILYLFESVMATLEEKYGREATKKAVIAAQVAHLLNQTLPTVDVQVHRSLSVTGTDTATGCNYKVHEA